MHKLFIDNNVNGFEKFPQLLGSYDIEPNHIIHVGAHQGQEVPFYILAGFDYITLVEPNPKLAQYLRQQYTKKENDNEHILIQEVGYNNNYIIKYELDRITIHEAACSNSDDELVTLSIMNQSKMSTVFTKLHPHDKVKETVQVKNVKLSDIAGNANVAVIDVQGLELDVLKSGNLSQFDLIVVQTSTIEDSTMAPSHESVVNYLSTHNFVEIPNWTKSRSYDVINRWSRGSYGQEKTGGKVFDSTFVRTK